MKGSMIFFALKLLPWLVLCKYQINVLAESLNKSPWSMICICLSVRPTSQTLSRQFPGSPIKLEVVNYNDSTEAGLCPLFCSSQNPAISCQLDDLSFSRLCVGPNVTPSSRGKLIKFAQFANKTFRCLRTQYLGTRISARERDSLVQLACVR